MTDLANIVIERLEWEPVLEITEATGPDPLTGERVADPAMLAYGLRQLYVVRLPDESLRYGLPSVPLRSAAEMWKDSVELPWNAAQDGPFRLPCRTSPPGPRYYLPYTERRFNIMCDLVLLLQDLRRSIGEVLLEPSMLDRDALRTTILRLVEQQRLGH